MRDRAIEISLGLQDQQRAAALDIFEEAFGAKFAPALPTREARRSFLGATLRSDRCLVASASEALLGFAGLQAASGRFRGGVIDGEALRFRDLRRMLGTVGAVRAMLTLGFLHHQAEPGELYIDFIAVSPAARGKGVGTGLLDEVAAVARADGCHWVRLDVIDTNPRAQALYERQGYRVIKEQKLYFLARFAGFEAVNTMELSLDTPAAAPGG